MKTKWFYAWIKDNSGRLIETRFVCVNKKDAYSNIMSNDSVMLNHPDLKLSDIHLSKYQY